MTSSTVTPDLLDDLARTAMRDGIDKAVVGAVVARPDGTVLLLHRPADDYLGGLWELPSGGVEDGESLIEALRREVAEESGLTVAAVGDYLGHFDYQSRSGRRTRQYNFTVIITGHTVQLSEHDAYQWADSGQQGQVSSAVQAILSAWRQTAA
ncbi:NUDIX hydrolase [Streptomyces triculaminicus]|uniref:NUDIX hydrolase n=1 Tax=Streptomyces triculaminicus TaxID=2816232 RepID=UPI0037D2BC24